MYVLLSFFLLSIAFLPVDIFSRLCKLSGCSVIRMEHKYWYFIVLKETIIPANFFQLRPNGHEKAVSSNQIETHLKVLNLNLTA